MPLILILAAITLSACDSLPMSVPVSLPLPLDTPKSIARGTATSTPFQPQATFTATPENPPTLAPTHTLPPTTAAPQPSSTAGSPTTSPSPTQATPSTTPSPQPSASPSPTLPPTKKASDDTPLIRVSVTTNCRTGPGVHYARISSLKPGKKVEILGRVPNYPYWVIRDPWGSGRSCWLWNYYASVQGDTSSLPVYQPPATSTPGATWTLTPTQDGTEKPSPPTKTDRPPTLTNTPVPPTATREITPGTPTDTHTPVPTNTPGPTNTPAPTATDTPVPPPTETPSSPYCPYTSVLGGEEDQIRSLINQARKQHGLPKLKIDFRLVTAARNHGRDMTCNGLWSHTSSDGTKAWERISMALGHGPNWCYNHCCCSEIFYGGSAGLTPQHAFNWWMTHPSQDPNYSDNIHKRTILSQYSTHLGVGVIYYQHGGTVRKFYTVDFARP